jgi:hypothetical protein
MDTSRIIEKFARMGVRARVRAFRDLRIDVGRDRKGEFFDIACDPDRTEIEVVDVRPALRHLLLLAREPGAGGAARSARTVKQKFLCGHDERHWFAAAVPESGGASDVRTAFLALKPSEIRRAEAILGVPERKRSRRRNRASVRQGEWFFISMRSARTSR